MIQRLSNASFNFITYSRLSDPSIAGRQNLEIPPGVLYNYNGIPGISDMRRSRKVPSLSLIYLSLVDGDVGVGGGEVAGAGSSEDGGFEVGDAEVFGGGGLDDGGNTVCCRWVIYCRFFWGMGNGRAHCAVGGQCRRAVL